VSSWQIVLPWLVPMVLLAFLSALFSGSEAALFSLRDKELKNLRRRGASGKMAADLVSTPERLLSAILFWNLMVNMTLFGIAGIVAGKLEASEQGGSRQAVLFTVATLFSVIFFSEMLPKSIGVLAPKRIALFIGLPMTIAVRIISPVLPLISVVNLGVQRLLWPSFTPEPEIGLDDIARAIELGTDDAALAQYEQGALQNLVHLADLRVDECMRPRSQLMMVRKPVTLDQFADALPPSGYALVIEGEADEIIGAIPVRSMRPSQFDDLSSVEEPVCYVPWSANVSSVLDLLQRQHLSVSVIVNEFGASIGVLSVEDILRQVLTGQFEHVDRDSQQPIEKIANGHFRAHGNMGVRKLAKALEVAPPEGRTVSIVGLMQRINERPPHLGDACEWSDYHFEVVREDENGNCIVEIRHTELTTNDVSREDVSSIDIARADEQASPPDDKDPEART
jgi:CBS domain containing-hemolysin-like protein